MEHVYLDRGFLYFIAKKNILEQRLFIVEKRDKVTLLPIVKKE